MCARQKWSRFPRGPTEGAPQNDGERRGPPGVPFLRTDAMSVRAGPGSSENQVFAWHFTRLTFTVKHQTTDPKCPRSGSVTKRIAGLAAMGALRQDEHRPGVYTTIGLPPALTAT
jgi:hypothetical protein